MDSSEGRTTAHRKPSGLAYRYSVESYWDKERKAPHTRQVCLRRIDGATGDIITTSKRRARKEKPDAGEVPPPVGAATKVYRPHLLLAKVAEETRFAGA
jgi:hypothetical protein